MKLILFRHGIAVDRDEFIEKKIDDAFRPLIEKGQKQTRKMAKILKDWDLSVDLIVSSPLVRAMQTAEIISETLRSSEILESVELIPSAPPQSFVQWLRSHAKRKTSVLAVGHEPHLSTLASWLLTSTTESFIELKKSGAICLEIESFEDLAPQTAELQWIVQPKLLLK